MFYRILRRIPLQAPAWLVIQSAIVVTWNVVCKEKPCPFHRQKVQALLGPNDYLRKDQFVYCFVHQSREKPNFPAMVVFTDEACFTREGIFNSHNSYVWADTNPHASSFYCQQQCFVVNIWAGGVSDFLIGPYLLPRWHNAQIYHVFLEEFPLSVTRKRVVPVRQGCGSLCTAGPRTSDCHLQ